MDQKFVCVKCQCEVLKKNRARHLKTKKCMNYHNEAEEDPIETNLIEEFKEIDDDLITQQVVKVFGYEIHTFPFKTNDLDLFFNEMFPKVKNLLDIKTNLKVRFYLKSTFRKCNTEEENIVDTSTKYKILLSKDDVDTFITEQFNKLRFKKTEQDMKGSGWFFYETDSLIVEFARYKPLKGSSFIELPKWIKDKKACINVKNNDNQCFKWAILSAQYNIQKDPQRVSKYKEHENKLNFEGIPFPVELDTIDTFENLNNLIINIYKIHDTNEEIEILRISKKIVSVEDNSKAINLLLIENENANHYCWIKNFSKLVTSQISKNEHKKFYCFKCLSAFTSEDRLTNHLKYCTDHKKVKLPEKGNNILKFQKHWTTQKVPFRIYADFECILTKLDKNEEVIETQLISNTLAKNIIKFKTDKSETECEHIACGYCYVVLNQNKVHDFKLFRGENSAEHFINSIHKTCLDLVQIQEKRLVMNPDDNTSFNQSTHCNCCKKEFNEKIIKVRDHDQYTGKYRQALCNICNLTNFRKPNFIPVYFHNLKGYDSHLIVSAIKKRELHLSVIPSNSEKYISFSIINHLQNNRTLEIRFLDSFAFMASSLDNLSSNLKPDQKVHLSKYCEDNNLNFNLLSKKGVYPYEYMDSFDRFNETSLPSIDKFYSRLTNSEITDDSYFHALTIWNDFKINNLGEYHDLYLKTDVLLLADVFENFINLSFETYGLDPCWYFTLAGYAWESMLKETKVELELFTDIDMHLFIEKGIRGGLVQSVKRYSKANNKYLDDYDSSQESNYIMYLDANNLYGWAMIQKLPYKDFEWVEEMPTDLRQYLIDLDKISKSCFVEVDLEYPYELHDLHRDLPFCPVRKDKLMCTLENKTNYVIHGRALIQALDHGLILKKINKILKFTESDWMKSYIDLNTDLRSKATNEFEKGFYKMMNNSPFGKTMENVRNRTDLKLANTEGKVEKGITSARLKNVKIINSDLLSMEFKKTDVSLNKPIFVGAAILDLSKTLMYDFFYDVLKPKYNSNINLCYMDTDSFILDIKTDDVYEDFSQFKDYFDFSNYSKDHKLYSNTNNKVLGKFKDEVGGVIIKENVNLMAKMYSLITNDEKLDMKKAKGVSKGVIKDLAFHNFKDVLFSKQNVSRNQFTIRSKHHKIYSIKQDKQALGYLDNKRIVLHDNIHTIPYGHKTLLLDAF